MSRKDFQLVADVVKAYGEQAGVEQRMLAEMFADRLAGQNERFDRGRFLAACGVEA